MGEKEDFIRAHAADMLPRAFEVSLHPGWAAAEDKWAPLPPLESLTGLTDMHDHVCGVGSAPKEGQGNIRQCRCGQWYQYDGRLWKKMGIWAMWRNRRFFTEMSDIFADLSDL